MRFGILQTLIDAWNQFETERAVVLCPTSLTSDYTQTRKWLSRCPIQDFNEGRKIITWVLQQKPVKTSRRVCMYLKSLYRWAASEDIALIDRNPISNFKMPKPPQEDEEVIVIPRNETGLVLAALENPRGTNWSQYAEFMLQTAMRTGEVRALKWSDIKDTKVLVHSNYTLTHGLKNSTKTNRKRWVPLNKKCLEILNNLRQDSEFIFPWNRYAYQSYFYDRMKTLHTAELITHKYRPYDLRHTAISRWLEEKIPVAQVANWAGNSSEIIWKHYVNVTQEYEIPEL